MTLRDMMYMTVIAKEKSITKAASRLFVVQPALSQCVQKVEKELGSPIFVRGTSGVTLTAEGRCFLEFADKTLKEQKSFEKQMDDLRQGAVGEILLGFTGTQATFVLPYFLPAFKEKYPEIHIVLVEASSDEIENKLSKGEIDIGIIHPPVMHEELDCFELSRDEMVIIPRRGSRFQSYLYYKDGEKIPYLDLEYLKDEPLVLTRSWQRSRMICEQIFRKAGICPIVKQVSRNISTLDALAQVDYATTLIPSKQISAGLVQKGHYKIDPRYSVPFAFYVATFREAYLSYAALKLLALLKDIKGTF